MTIKTESVSLEDARRVVAAGEAKADEIGSPSNIAVVDVGGNLVAHIRMDEAWIGSVDISINKAFTSRAFDITKPTWPPTRVPVSSSSGSTHPTTDAS